MHVFRKSNLSSHHMSIGDLHLFFVTLFEHLSFCLAQCDSHTIFISNTPMGWIVLPFPEGDVTFSRWVSHRTIFLLSSPGSVALGEMKKPRREKVTDNMECHSRHQDLEEGRARAGNKEKSPGRRVPIMGQASYSPADKGDGINHRDGIQTTSSLLPLGNCQQVLG